MHKMIQEYMHWYQVIVEMRKDILSETNKFGKKLAPIVNII